MGNAHPTLITVVRSPLEGVEVRSQIRLHFHSLCKANHFHRTFNSQGFSVEFNPLDFVKGVCSKVAFAAMRATYDWNVLDHKQVFTLAICPSNPADDYSFASTNITYHLAFSEKNITRNCSWLPLRKLYPRYWRQILAING